MREAILAAALVALTLPAFAQVATPTPVERAALSRDAFSTGTLAQNDGAMAPALWRGAQGPTLERLLAMAPARPPTPAIGVALARALLSSGDAPDGASPALGGRKLLALARAGYVDEARTIASLSTAPRNDPQVAEALATADLLDGALAQACQRNAALSAGRDAPFWARLRVLCYAAANERDAADLTFGVLRDQGLLDGADEAWLAALAIGAKPSSPVAVETALHLAAARHLGVVPTAGDLARADGGVLRAAMRDEKLELRTRIVAAWRAHAMGVAPPRDVLALYRGAQLDLADIARAADIAAERPDDPMTDVLLHRSISQMTAPEFLRDKAARIALALSVADDFPRAYAASILYGADIRTLEGALIEPAEAGRFALARMTGGDAEAGARWLSAMLGGGPASALSPADAARFAELVSLLSVLDGARASALAQSAGVALEEPPAPSRHARPANGRMAGVVEAALEAAASGIQGQAALAALAVAEDAAAGDALARVVLDRSLRVAGLSALQRSFAFHTLLMTRLGPAEVETPPAEEAATPSPAAADAAAPPVAPVRATPASANAEAGLAPRLKPRRSP